MVLGGSAVMRGWGLVEFYLRYSVWRESVGGVYFLGIIVFGVLRFRIVLGFS